MNQMMRWAVMATSTLGFSVSANAASLEAPEDMEKVRVCAAPHNMPYSNEEEEGFDNRIADLLAEKLDMEVEYFWFPQRIGFSRNTIKARNDEGDYRCDIAFSQPEHTDFIMPTKPYYSSIESIVYRSGEGYEINSLEDIGRVSQEHDLRIGLFDRAIATGKLLEMGLADDIEYYQMMTGDLQANAGRVVQDIADGKIDVAPMWGPVAGYHASISDVDMTVVPLNELGQRYIFSFSMGVRHGDNERKEMLNNFIDMYQDEIDEIIAEYNLPSLENVNATPAKKVRKNDDD